MRLICTANLSSLMTFVESPERLQLLRTTATRISSDVITVSSDVTLVNVQLGDVHVKADEAVHPVMMSHGNQSDDGKYVNKFCKELVLHLFPILFTEKF